MKGMSTQLYTGGSIGDVITRPETIQRNTETPKYNNEYSMSLVSKKVTSCDKYVAPRTLRTSAQVPDQALPGFQDL